MTHTSRQEGLPGWLLVSAPVAALVAVVALWVGIDVVGEVGPLDKAKLGWLVAVPLTLAVPVLAAWTGGRLRRPGRAVIGAIVGVGAALAIGWPMWIAYAGQCAAVGLAVPISPIATIAAIVGLTMFVGVLAAGRALDADRPGPVVVGLAFVSAAVAFAIRFGIFVLMSPSLLFGQCVVRPLITP
jgi:hypothetical protein